MQSLLDRLAALDAARLVAVSGALIILLLTAAWVVSAVVGRVDAAALVGVVVAVVVALIGLLYAFELGTPPASV
ncbi:MAG TPA: hypothetical protein VNG93_09575 [Candidatus Dormibacteraeota bacterium]|nr:hypothetical protein [Candidatus Dormibacteraeota bacterium]